MRKLIIVAGIAAGICCYSCKEDETVILQDPTTFVLNTPAYAANHLYDLEKSSGVELSCSQPDYGYTAATTYQVQVSMNNDFQTEGNFETLASTYSKAKMNVDASEIAVAATNLSIANGKEETDFPLIDKIYVRLIASVANGMKPITSNTVELAQCRIHFALPPVLLPTEMYMIGSAIAEKDGEGWTWGSDAFNMVPIHSEEGGFWRMVYLKSGGELKFNQVKDWNGTEFGYTGTSFGGDSDPGVSDSNGNIKINKGGWYIVVVHTALNGRTPVYTVEFYPPNVYLFGDAVGGVWDPKPENMFSIPADRNSDFVSPAVQFPQSADGGLRMCVKIPNHDWWHTEFIFFGGKLEYRGTGNDQDRIQANVGQKAYVNFTAGTGKLN